MKTVLQDHVFLILRFDKGEDVVEKLALFCQQEKITAGYFTGLGACGEITIAYYDLKNKKYLDKTFSEDLEIISLTGNVAVLENKPAIHCHGSFADKKYKVVAGHVKNLIVSTTCELHLTILEGTLARAFNKPTGLNLLK